MQQIRLLVAYVGALDCFAEGAQPLDGAMTRQTRDRLLRVRIALLAQRLQACQIRVDAQRPGGVAKLADLPIDPRPVDGDWCTRRLGPVCR